MNSYLIFKILYILLFVLIVGIGFGMVYYLFFINCFGWVSLIVDVVCLVVWVDWWFIMLVVIFQLIFGLWFVYMVGWVWDMLWIVFFFVFFVIIGVCWLLVVWLQVCFVKMVEQVVVCNEVLFECYWCYVWYWERFGYLVFVVMFGVYFLMVFKL